MSPSRPTGYVCDISYLFFISGIAGFGLVSAGGGGGKGRAVLGQGTGALILVRLGQDIRE